MNNKYYIVIQFCGFGVGVCGTFKSKDEAILFAKKDIADFVDKLKLINASDIDIYENALMISYFNPIHNDKTYMFWQIKEIEIPE